MNDDWITCYLCGRPARVNLNGQLRKHKAQLATMTQIGRWCENRSAFRGGPPVIPAEIPGVVEEFNQIADTSTDGLKWITVSLTTRHYLDLDGNEVDFVTWLRIHLPDVAKAWGLDQ